MFLLRIGHLPVSLAAAGLLAVASLGSSAADVEARTPRHIVYDYAVSSYCGFLTPEVEAGFRQELEDVTKRDGLTPDETRAFRIAGWVDADREWSNRGLGGFRAWCETHGFAAVSRFLSIVRDGRDP